MHYDIFIRSHGTTYSKITIPACQLLSDTSLSAASVQFIYEKNSENLQDSIAKTECLSFDVLLVPTIIPPVRRFMHTP